MITTYTCVVIPSLRSETVRTYGTIIELERCSKKKRGYIKVDISPSLGLSLAVVCEVLINYIAVSKLDQAE